jgi:hypothetical protein
LWSLVGPGDRPDRSPRPVGGDAILQWLRRLLGEGHGWAGVGVS